MTSSKNPARRGAKLIGLALAWALIGAACTDSGTDAMTKRAIFEVGAPVASDREHVAAAYAVSLDRDRLVALEAGDKAKHFIRLPDGTTLHLRVSEVEGEPPRVWRGELYDEQRSHGSFTLSRSGNRYAASFRLGSEHFQLKSTQHEDLLLLILEKRVPPPPGPPIAPNNE